MGRKNITPDNQKKKEVQKVPEGGVNTGYNLQSMSDALEDLVPEEIKKTIYSEDGTTPLKMGFSEQEIPFNTNDVESEMSEILHPSELNNNTSVSAEELNRRSIMVESMQSGFEEISSSRGGTLGQLAEAVQKKIGANVKVVFTKDTKKDLPRIRELMAREDADPNVIMRILSVLTVQGTVEFLTKVVIDRQSVVKTTSVSDNPSAIVGGAVDKVDVDKITRLLKGLLPEDAAGNSILLSVEDVTASTVDVYLDMTAVISLMFDDNASYNSKNPNSYTVGVGYKLEDRIEDSYIVVDRMKNKASFETVKK